MTENQAPREINALGYIEVQTDDVERWHTLAFDVLGFARGSGPDADALYLRHDDREAVWPILGRSADTGEAVPVLICPHTQRRAMSWCSVTRIRIGGRSNTCRRVAPTSSRARASAPQPPQQRGSWRMTSSGSDTCSMVRPRRPAWPPRFFRNDFGAGLANSSEDGGFEEFREFVVICSSSSAIRAS